MNEKLSVVITIVPENGSGLAEAWCVNCATKEEIELIRRYISETLKHCFES